MALFTPSESPAVVVKEIDLTSGVPNVQSSTGAFVGNFRWGPVGERVSISDEDELADKFGTPVEKNEALEAKVQERVKNGSYLEAAHLIPDDMASTFVLTGTPDEVKKRLEPAWEIADSVTLVPPALSLPPEKTGDFVAFGFRVVFGQILENLLGL